MARRLLAQALSLPVIVCALGLLAAHSVLGDRAVIRSMVATFEAGGVTHGWPPWAPTAHWDASFGVTDARATVPRRALTAQLAALLRPEASSQYALIVGESGTGKSTAVRNAVRSLPTPKGAIYVAAPELVASFSVDLALATGFFTPFDPLRNFYGWWGGQATPGGDAGEEPRATWAVLRRALQSAAAAFRAKHGRPAALIIDAADYVAKQDPAFFLRLQDFAKVCADMGDLRVVFVSSEGAALPLMRASSAWSRALKPPFEVPDIDDDAAVAFLVGRGVAQRGAEEAVRYVTGGRFSLLLDVASAAAAKPIEAIRAELDVQTSAVLKKLGVGPTHAFFADLVEAGSVAVDKALDHLPDAALSSLLAANVVAMHPDGTITAQARHIESFLRKAHSRAQHISALGG